MVRAQSNSLVDACLRVYTAATRAATLWGVPLRNVTLRNVTPWNVNPWALIACAVISLAVTSSALGKPQTPPPSQQYDLMAASEIATMKTPSPDVAAILDIDAERATTGPRPHRVAVAVPAPVDVVQAATREFVAGGELLRYRIQFDDGYFTSAKFSAFDLPDGATLHFVSESHVYADGPYGHVHNRTTGRFGMPIVPGNAVIIELFVPNGQQATLVLESVSYGFRQLPMLAAFSLRSGEDTAPGPLYGGGGPFGCQRDINCPEGAPYQQVKRAVAEGYDGQFVCSGQLINNTAEDNRYLYLTAAHCEWWLDPSTLSFYWDYENSGCGTNDFPPFTFSTGSTDLYHSTNPNFDLQLLELDGTDLDETYNVYYMGWSLSMTAPQQGAIIGFPDDKPKQIAYSLAPMIDCSVGGCPGGFGGPYWRLDNYDVGFTQGGSSGGGLLNEDLHVVGVLTGGVGTTCNNFAWDEFYKLNHEYAQIAEHLDPLRTGSTSLHGKDWQDKPVKTVPAASSWGLLITGLLFMTLCALCERIMNHSLMKSGIGP